MEGIEILQLKCETRLFAEQLANIENDLRAFPIGNVAAFVTTVLGNESSRKKKKRKKLEEKENEETSNERCKN